MRKLAIVAIVAGLLALTSGTAQAASPPDVGRSHVISVLGVAQVQGRDVFVDVMAVVPPGASDQEVAANVLREQGARPVDRTEVESAAYTTTGLNWPQFSDQATNNDFVVQNYNSSNEPSGGQTALTNSEVTWSSVSGSSFDLNYGGPTARYPSLVKESPGPQYLDGYNDVGWASLSGSTLGVTWYTTSGQAEADMALNTNFSWGAGGYDMETVFLHENGHVVGLGHSTDTSAVMYAYYNDVQRTLAADDQAGVLALYPSNSGPPVEATFDVTVSPTTKTVRAGQPARYSVTVTAVNGYSSAVTLSVTVPPAGPTATIAPITVTPTSGGAKARLTVTTMASAGTYMVTVTGTGTDGKTDMAVVTLTIK